MNTIESIPPGAEVESLLTEAQLPVSDLAGRPGLTLLGVREDGRLVGVVGIEVHGDAGLLRSLAVAASKRGSGLGVRLVAAAERWAAERGIGTLYLLTTTAERLFARLGYEAAARSGAPASIAATPQFRDLCPASSAFMRKALHAAPVTR